MKNLTADDWITASVIGLIVVILLAYQIYNRLITLKLLNKLLEEHYHSNSLQIIRISKLSISEKLKYGVPLNPFISLYSYTFRMFTSFDESYCRSIETTDENGNEQIRYVEVRFSGKGTDVKEFDTYNF